jgi:hypothetical protein
MAQQTPAPLEPRRNQQNRHRRRSGCCNVVSLKDDGARRLVKTCEGLAHHRRRIIGVIRENADKQVGF